MATDFKALLTDVQQYLANGQALQQRVANALGEVGAAQSAMDLVSPQLIQIVQAQLQTVAPSPVPVTTGL